MINRNFSFLIFGRIFTNLADSIYYVLSTWLLYEMTNNVVMSGIGGAVIKIPDVLSFLTGPLIDRVNKKFALVLFTILQAILITILATLYVFDLLSPVILIILMFFVALFNEPTYYLETCLVPKIVPKNKLVKANSLLSVSNEGINTLFNSVSGVLIAYLGVLLVFIINIWAFIIAFGLFILIKVVNNKHNIVTNNNEQIDKDDDEEDEPYGFKEYLAELKDGAKLMLHPLLWPTILPIIFLNSIVIGVEISYPYISSQMGNVEFYGYLLGSISLGVLAGVGISNFISNKISVPYISIYVTIFETIIWILILSIGYSNNYLLIALFGLSAIGAGVLDIVLPTYNQVVVPEQHLGKINTSIGSMIVIGAPIGAFVGGFIVEYLSINILYILIIIVHIGSIIYWYRCKEFMKVGKLNDLSHIEMR